MNDTDTDLTSMPRNSSMDEHLEIVKPTKPKRPMTAYNFFFRDQRKKIVAEAKKKRLAMEKCGADKKETSKGSPKPNGSDGDCKMRKRKRKKQEVSFEDLGRIIGQRWRDLPDEDFAPYEAMAEADSKRYKREMKKFHADELASLCMGFNTQGKGSTEQDDTNLSDPSTKSVYQGTKLGHDRAAASVSMRSDLKRPSSYSMPSYARNLRPSMVPMGLSPSGDSPMLDTLYQQSRKPFLPSMLPPSQLLEFQNSCASPTATAPGPSRVADSVLSTTWPYLNDVSGIGGRELDGLKYYPCSRTSRLFSLSPSADRLSSQMPESSPTEALSNLYGTADSVAMLRNLSSPTKRVETNSYQQAIQFYLNEIRRLQAKSKASNHISSPAESAHKKC